MATEPKKRKPQPLTGEALVRAMVADEKLVRESNEAFDRMRAGFPGKRSNGRSMPGDVYLSRGARAFLDALPLEEQRRVRDAIDYLMIDPEPDGSSKVRLPLPYRFGTISYRSGGFFFTYDSRTPW